MSQELMGFIINIVIGIVVLFAGYKLNKALISLVDLSLVTNF